MQSPVERENGPDEFKEGLLRRGEDQTLNHTFSALAEGKEVAAAAAQKKCSHLYIYIYTQSVCSRCIMSICSLGAKRSPACMFADLLGRGFV